MAKHSKTTGHKVAHKRKERDLNLALLDDRAEAIKSPFAGRVERRGNRFNARATSEQMVRRPVGGALADPPRPPDAVVPLTIDGHELGFGKESPVASTERRYREVSPVTMWQTAYRLGETARWLAETSFTDFLTSATESDPHLIETTLAAAIYALTDGEHYFVDAPIVGKLLGATDPPQDWTPTPELLPAPAGFMVLDRCPRLPSARPGHSMYLGAITWVTLGIDRANSALFVRGSGDWHGVDAGAHSVYLMYWSFQRPDTDTTSTELPREMSEHLVPWNCYELRFDAPAFKAHPQSDQANHRIAFFGAFCRFLKADILEAPRQPEPERFGDRRRIRDALAGRLPTVRVVSLRRVIREPGAPTDPGEPIEWSCRWTVRGHERVYHRGTDREKRAIVRSYVKGPADKPLREPIPVVYEVKR